MDAAAFEQVYGAFGDFHAYFAPLFGRRETRDHSRHYLQALLVQSGERRNAENLSEAVPASARVMQRFLTELPWDDDAVIGRLQEYLGPRLGHPDAVWVLDGSDFPKQGRKSVGVARQYCGRLGKVANCQAGMFLAYVSPLGRAFTIRQHKSLRNLIEAIPEEDWTPIPYWMDGAADVAETTYTPFQSEPGAAPVRLIVRRMKPTPGSQLALFATYSYHGFITDRDGETLELEADHRRHAEVENAIRDLKYGVGLNHKPSGCFAANGAWLAVQVMAHNLARWTARIGLGEQIVTTKTLRRRFFSLTGRLTRSARRLTLHLPQRWPWETQFRRPLARLRAIPLPA